MWWNSLWLGPWITGIAGTMYGHRRDASPSEGAITHYCGFGGASRQHETRDTSHPAVWPSRTSLVAFDEYRAEAR
jgi:hypothetical protein